MTAALQQHLRGITAPELPLLLLSIKAEFADRIFQGTKKFELRKSLPRKPFRRVYLYQSGSTGVVGCFDVARVVEQPLDQLWTTVGELATTRERFYSYFSTVKKGFAIEIRNPIRFSTPVNVPQLNELSGTFTAPLSYHLIPPESRLGVALEGVRDEILRRKTVTLRPIKASETDRYRDLVTKEIGAYYDEITSSFAENIIKIHRQGHDPYGFLTRSKTVLSILSDSGAHLGYTTLTFKLGDSVKTGPTILFDEFQGLGYGLATRAALENYVSQQGCRKIYCTCPDNKIEVVGYLLKSGLRVEAHLAKQYTQTSGELVFGKILRSEPGSYKAPRRARSPNSRIVGAHEFTSDMLSRALQRMFSTTWFTVNREFGRRIVRATQIKSADSFEEKPKRLVCLRRDSECVAAVILVPKRGGAAKALCLSDTAHPESLRSLFRATEQLAVEESFRKLYFVHPLRDHPICDTLMQSGYATEGILREPYVPGQDVLVAARLFAGGGHAI